MFHDNLVACFKTSRNCFTFHVARGREKTFTLLFATKRWKRLLTRNLLHSSKNKWSLCKTSQDQKSFRPTEAFWYHGQELSFRRSGQETQEKTQEKRKEEHLKSRSPQKNEFQVSLNFKNDHEVWNVGGFYCWQDVMQSYYYKSFSGFWQGGKYLDNFTVA